MVYKCKDLRGYTVLLTTSKNAWVEMIKKKLEKSEHFACGIYGKIGWYYITELYY